MIARISFAVALLAATAWDQGRAFAQNSTNAPPPSASKEGGVQGDPNGAIRSLGAADDGSKQNKPPVTVPHLGGEGESRTGGTPAGTDGPR